MSMTILLPSIFFSGFIFPRETMPWIFYAISTMLPATYFIELMRAIILRGATLRRILAASAHPRRHGRRPVHPLRAALQAEGCVSSR